MLALFAVACASAPPPAPAAPAAPQPLLRLAGVPVARFTLDDAAKIAPLLAPLGYTPILGCSEVTDPGSTVTCVYGAHPVTISVHRAEPKAVDQGFLNEEGATVPNAVSFGDGPYLLVSAGTSGDPGEARAVAEALWDGGAQTFAGAPLATLTDQEALRAPLSSRGFVGDVLGYGAVFAMLELEVIARHDSGAAPTGTYAEDGAGDSVSVHLSAVGGEGPAGAEGALLEALTAPPTP